MEIIQKSAWVLCPINEVYALVADIESYPQFLPWCSSAKILKQTQQEVEASLTLSKGGLSKSFTTRNIMQINHQIEIRLLAGPFKHFEGIWTFAEEKNGTRVSLHLEFSFASRIIAMMMGPLFQPVANTLLDAFIKRAQEKCQNKH